MVKRSVRLTGVPLVAAVCAALGAGSGTALAQTRPSNAVFVETRPDPTHGQRLDITLSSAAGYDKDSSPDGGDLAGVGLQGAAGQSIAMTTSGSYALVGRRMQFRATGTYIVRYYGSLENVLHSSNDDKSHATAAGFLYQTPRTTFVANQTANYMSSLMYTFLPVSGAVAPGAGPPATADYGLSSSETYSYTSTADYTRHMNARSTVSAAAGWERSNIFGGRPDSQKLNVYKGRAGLGHQFGRNLIATGTYVLRTGDVAAGRLVPYGQVVTEQGAEFGLDYRRPLSATRSFTLQARLGGTTIVLPAVLDPEGGRSQGRRYEQFAGQLTTTYDFGRSWQMAGTVRRGLEYVSGFSEPVFADSVTARLDGLLGRGLDFRATAAFASGESAISRAASLFTTYTANVRVRYALTPSWATYVEYLYYLYDARGTVALVPGLPPHLERNGVRAGFMLRIPAVGKVIRAPR